MSKTAILTGPDGRYYEIPLADLAGYAVPPEKVADLRKELGARAASAEPAEPGALPPGHAAAPGSTPPGHAAAGPAPAGHSAPGMQSMSIQPNGQGGVVLNFYFGGAPPTAPDAGTGTDAGVEGYHLTPDESGLHWPHTEMLYGDYIDKQGNPATGWHSHDPVTGNAQ